MSDFHATDTGKRSHWERPISQPEAPAASHQVNQQQAYQDPYQNPPDYTKGSPQPPPGYDQGATRGGQGYGQQGYGQQQQQQPQIVYVNNNKRQKDHVALGFCAGCAAGLCCCGCTVM